VLSGQWGGPLGGDHVEDHRAGAGNREALVDSNRHDTGDPAVTTIETVPHLLTIDQLAEHLGITTRHVRRLIAERRIP